MKELAKEFFSRFGFDTGWQTPKPIYLEPYIPEDVEFSRAMLEIEIKR
jgi:hypothetical protein